MKYFERENFACKCGCGFATVDYELVEVLDELRAYFDSPTFINSACRCREYNEVVQKKAKVDYVPYSSKSKHMQGIAADIVVKNVSPERVQDYLLTKYPNSKGIGVYNSFTHIDTRTNKSRW